MNRTVARTILQLGALAFGLSMLTAPTVMATEAQDRESLRCSPAPEPSAELVRSGASAVDNLHQLLLQAAVNTPWHFRSKTRTQKAAMRKMIKDATPLAHFMPYRLIRLIQWNPAAGYPGIVTADLRVLYDPEAQTFVSSNVDWNAVYRAQHPIDVGALSPVERRSYIAELVSMVSGRDHRGFTPVEVSAVDATPPTPGVYKVIYKPGRPPGGGQAEAVVEFDVNGAVLARGPLFAPGRF